MATRRRSRLDAEARRHVAPAMRSAGEKVRAARRRRRLIQAALGRRADLSQSAISRLELGKGATLSVVAWKRVAMALDLPLDFALGRDAREEPADAGHLAMQELVLRLGRSIGYRRTFELATKPADPFHSTDVGLRDDVHRRLLHVECFNAFGSINAAARSTDRKRADAEALAIAVGDGEPYSVHVCWVVRATRRNRELLDTYPEIFATRFPGSSREWVRTLTDGAAPPGAAGLVWCDVRATRLIEWRPRRRVIGGRLA